MIAPEWAALLNQHIESKARGYQAQMHRDTGCSEAMINRIKTASIDSSEWVEVLARYARLPIPPLAVDEVQAEMLELSSRMSERNRKTVLQLMRNLVVEDPEKPNDTKH